jgi:hypothetical protein
MAASEKMLLFQVISLWKANDTIKIKQHSVKSDAIKSRVNWISLLFEQWWKVKNSSKTQKFLFSGDHKTWILS